MLSFSRISDILGGIANSCDDSHDHTMGNLFVAPVYVKCMGTTTTAGFNLVIMSDISARRGLRLRAKLEALLQ